MLPMVSTHSSFVRERLSRQLTLAQLARHSEAPTESTMQVSDDQSDVQWSVIRLSFLFSGGKLHARLPDLTLHHIVTHSARVMASGGLPDLPDLSVCTFPLLVPLLSSQNLSDLKI